MKLYWRAICFAELFGLLYGFDMSKANAFIVDNRGKFVLGIGEILGAVSIDGGPVRIDGKLKISSLATIDVVAIANVRSYNVAALQDSLCPHGLSIEINNGDHLPRSDKSPHLASEVLRNNQVAIVPESEYAASKKRVRKSASSTARLTKS